MIIRSIIAALLLASGSLHAALVNSYDLVYSYAGTISHGSNGIQSDSVSGSGFESDGFSIPDGPDGMTFYVGGSGSFNDLDDHANFSLNVSHRIQFPSQYPSTITTTMTVTFDLSSAAAIQFNFLSPMFTGEVTGSSSIKLDGFDVVSGTEIALGSGSHTLVFAINGSSIGWEGTYESFGLDASITAIPEPSSWALLAGGVAAAWGLRRRKAA